MFENIDWLFFLEMLPFVAFGQIAYIVHKLAVAKLRKERDYDFKIFVDRNLLSWVAGFMINVIVCYIFTRGVNIGTAFTGDVLALLLGVSGGSMGKGIIKILTGLKRL